MTPEKLKALVDNELGDILFKKFGQKKESEPKLSYEMIALINIIAVKLKDIKELKEIINRGY